MLIYKIEGLSRFTVYMSKKNSTGAFEGGEMYLLRAIEAGKGGGSWLTVVGSPVVQSSDKFLLPHGNSQ